MMTQNFNPNGKVSKGWPIKPFKCEKSINIYERDGQRYYRLSCGTDYPSITTLLSRIPNPALEEWKNSVGQTVAIRKSELGKRRGSVWHKIISKYIDGSLLEQDLSVYSINTRKIMDGLFRTLDDNLKEVFLLEQPLWCDALGIAGTPDLVCRWGTEDCLSVVDFKTSTNSGLDNNVLDKYFTQAYAYSTMFRERVRRNYMGEYSWMDLRSNLVIVQISQDQIKPEIYYDRVATHHLPKLVSAMCRD